MLSYYFILNEMFKPSTGIEPESPRIRGMLARFALSPPNSTSPAIPVLPSWQPEKVRLIISSGDKIWTQADKAYPCSASKPP